MRFLGPAGEGYSLEFTHEEKALLLHLLSLYPLVPQSYHQLTRDKKLPKRDENQQLLDEALLAQREQNRKEVSALIQDPQRFLESGGKFLAGFQRTEMEWLLQVMNDVRVGCWIALGSPGYETRKKSKPGKEALRHMMFMELAGAFEMFFLGIINGDVPPEPKG